MIVSRISPDSPNGDLASVIHTPAFNSFVSTALVNGRWESVIFSGNPGVDSDLFPVMKYLYPADCDAHDAELMNNAVAEGIDIFAETGWNLQQIGEHIAQTWIRKGVAIQVLWCSARSSAQSALGRTELTNAVIVELCSVPPTGITDPGSDE